MKVKKRYCHKTVCVNNGSRENIKKGIEKIVLSVTGSDRVSSSFISNLYQKINHNLWSMLKLRVIFHSVLYANESASNTEREKKKCHKHEISIFLLMHQAISRHFFRLIFQFHFIRQWLRFFSRSQENFILKMCSLNFEQSSVARTRKKAQNFKQMTV